MIYVTGDLHGDKKRFSDAPLKALKRGDILLVCGDFGFLWSGSPEEKKTLEWIGKHGYHVLFVEGTHDNLDLLESYPLEEWNGGLTRPISGNLRHLVRGEVFNLEGTTFLALGGGQSDDFAQRDAGVNWWPGELPEEEDLLRFRKRLDQVGWKLDFILSHQAPTNIDSCLTHRICDVTLLTAFMDELQRKCAFRKWYFGNYHLNKLIPPHYQCLYDQVLLVGGQKKKWSLWRK